MRDEVRTIVIAGLSQLDLIADPGRAPLFAITCLMIVGRTNKARRRRNILVAAPAQLAILIEIILDPNLTQQLDGRDAAALELWDHRWPQVTLPRLCQ